MKGSPQRSEDKTVATWLFVCSFMIFIMVVIGGLTRLTGSGLSMVEWKPLIGWLPPLNEKAWQEVFALYQKTPQFISVNYSMDLAGFKGIFWLEYIHRLIGRITGVVFIIPLSYFLLKKRLQSQLVVRFMFIFLLGAIQGGVGWYMVKSGLQDNPMVSQYRLTLHLGFAVLIYAMVLWSGLNLWQPETARGRQKHKAFMAASMLTGLVFLTILSGGLVAGLHAGLIFNTFPLMDGRLIPTDYLNHHPAYLAFFEHVPSVQWDHRFLAMLVFLGTVTFWVTMGKTIAPGPGRRWMYLLIVMVLVQLALGIATLLLAVPIALASLHQTCAILVFSVALVLAHHLSLAAHDARPS